MITHNLSLLVVVVVVDIFNNPASFKYSAAAEFNKLFLLNICNLDQLHM